MIESAEVFYQADDPHVTLKLRLDAEDIKVNGYTTEPFFRFLTPTAYKQLRASILSIECEVCGGNHPDVIHGAVILTLDTGRDTPEGVLGNQIVELKFLFDNTQERQHFNTMQELHEKYLIDLLALEVYEGQIADRSASPPEMDFSYYDSKMSEVAGEAGYVIVNNSDAGAWMIYAAVDDDEDGDIVNPAIPS